MNQDIPDAPWRNAATSALCDKFSGQSNVQLLELGCGDGFVLETLQNTGVFSVRGTTFRTEDDDYIRKRPYPNGISVDHGIDLNEPLPYQSESYDAVVSTEVIEHVESHRRFVSEAARVLKPGGVLVLTTPNLYRVLSRFTFLLTGTHKIKHRLLTSSVPLESMEEFHHRCVNLPHLHWLLWVNGMRIVETRPTEVKLISKLARLVFLPFVGFTSRRAINQHQHMAVNDVEYRNDLHKQMVSRNTLVSEQLCLICEKNQAV